MLEGSRLEALVRRMWWRVFIRPLVSFVIWTELVVVRAHSWGKKGEISARASVAESEVVLLVSVEVMIICVLGLVSRPVPGSYIWCLILEFGGVMIWSISSL
jgi:hypothetical protein